MKKSILMALVAIVFCQTAFATNSNPTLPSLTVIATSGLSLREAPDASSPIIKIVPYGDQVIIREDQPDTTFASRIDWVDGEWIAIEHEGSVGFIFNGYLTNLPLPAYEAEFSPYDTELLYPLETWAAHNFIKSGAPDTIIRNGTSKVVHNFINGNRLIQSNQMGFYKSELYLHDVRIMDAYNLLEVMLGENEVAINSFKKNSLFIEDFKGEITQVKINLEDTITIRKLGPDLIRIAITSVDQYCKL